MSRHTTTDQAPIPLYVPLTPDLQPLLSDAADAALRAYGWDYMLAISDPAVAAELEASGYIVPTGTAGFYRLTMRGIERVG